MRIANKIINKSLIVCKKRPCFFALTSCMSKYTNAMVLTTKIKTLNIIYPKTDPIPVTRKPNAKPQHMQAIRSAI